MFLQRRVAHLISKTCVDFVLIRQKAVEDQLGFFSLCTYLGFIWPAALLASINPLMRRSKIPDLRKVRRWAISGRQSPGYLVVFPAVSVLADRRHGSIFFCLCSSEGAGVVFAGLFWFLMAGAAGHAEWFAQLAGAVSLVGSHRPASSPASYLPALCCPLAVGTGPGDADRGITASSSRGLSEANDPNPGGSQ